MTSLTRFTPFMPALVLALGLTLAVSFGQTSPAAGSAGTTTTPPSGNYPGSGSSPQPGVVSPAHAPSGSTPGDGMGGVTNTPPDGITPGSGASPTAPSSHGNAAGPGNGAPYNGH